MTMKRLLLPLILLAGCASTPPPPTVSLPESAETLDGGRVQLAGRPVALVFWQSW